MLRLLPAGLFALALPMAAFAGAVVESLKGDVQVGGAPVFQGQRVFPQATITTDAGAQVFLRFDDGMQIVLSGDSVFRLVDFRYAKGGPNDRAVLDLLRGAARVVTGAVARDNPKQFFFRTPQTQLSVERPSDFTVALVNPAYVSVSQGTVLSSNAWGTVPLNAGTTSAIANSAAAPASISASSLPSSASLAMNNLSLASVTPPAGGAAVGAEAVAGGVGGAAYAVPLVVIGAGIAAAAALAADDDATTTHATTTHH